MRKGNSYKVVTHKIGENLIEAKAPKQFESSAGEKIGVEFDMYDMHFDKRTGSDVVEPAKFRVSNTTLSQLPVETGGNVRISVDVSNLGEMSLVEPAGKEFNPHVKVESEELIVTFGRGRGKIPNSGEKLWLELDEEKMHLFDRESGEAVVNSREVVE